MMARGGSAVWLDGTHLDCEGTVIAAESEAIDARPVQRRSDAMTSATVASALDEALDRLMNDEATLASRLERYTSIINELYPPYAGAVDRLVARLHSIDAGVGAPQIGQPMPQFLMPDERGRLVSSDELLAKGPLVVAFRRGHWCPFCQLATEALSRIQGEVGEIGAGIVVISPETIPHARALRIRTGAKFPILSDIDNGYALSLGLAISLGDEMRVLLTRRGRDLAAYQGNGAWLLPIPATFVLDRSGTIVLRHVDPDYRSRAAIEDILAVLRALR
jgi:peroxiredoxin